MNHSEHTVYSTKTDHLDISGIYAYDREGTPVFILQEDDRNYLKVIYVDKQVFYYDRYTDGYAIFKADVPEQPEQPEQSDYPLVDPLSIQVGDLVEIQTADGPCQLRIDGLVGSPPPYSAYFQGWGSVALKQCRLISPALTPISTPDPQKTPKTQVVFLERGGVFRFVAKGREKYVIAI